MNWVKLGIVLLIALSVRIYNVNKIPPSLSWDEVSIGYNAYSILKTGKDEHGKFLPLDTFVAFGDYKPPIPIYITVPFVWILGLNEFAVRLPSIIAGVITVLLTYLLVKELFREYKQSESLALISAFVLAVSPWHVNISRAGFEANIATMFLVLGIWWILRALRTKKLLIFMWLPFVLAIYTFNSARYFVPFLGLGFLIWRRNEFLKFRTLTIISFILASIVIVPIIPHLLSKEARLRFTEVNIFSDSQIVKTSNERIQADENTPWAKIIYNRRIGYATAYLKHYLDHFDLSFLFIHGDGNPKFSIQDVGQLYLIELPFFVLGIYWILRKTKPQGMFLLYWLLSGIIPAATARETPHALRILTTLPTWQIFVAFGIVSGYQYGAKKLGKTLTTGIIVILYLGNVLFYLHNYYNHYPLVYSGEWQYGYREAIQSATAVQNNYEQIVVSDSIGRPYMYVLFYTHYSPTALWQTKDANFDAAGFYNVYGFGKYRFVRNAPTKFTAKTLYILPPSQVPENAHIVKIIKLLNGNPILTVFDIS